MPTVATAASPLAEYTPSEVVLLFPDAISLSFPDAFVGSCSAPVSGRHVDAVNLTPRLVQYTLAALVSRGDLTLSSDETTSRVLGIRETSVRLHASSATSEWPAGSLEAQLLLAATQGGDDGADLASTIESCIACVSGTPHLVFYNSLMRGLHERGVVEEWTQRRLLIFSVRRWTVTEVARAALADISPSEVKQRLTRLDRVNESHAAEIVSAHNIAMIRCTDNGT